MPKHIDIPPESSSKLHKSLYQIFCNSTFFQNMTIKQEVSVKDLVPSYNKRRHKIDWLIKDLNVVIELHGRQHRHPTKWGSISAVEAKLNLASSKKRDRMKEEAIRGAGYTYVCIWYDEDLTEELLVQKITEATMDE